MSIIGQIIIQVAFHVVVRVIYQVFGFTTDVATDIVGATREIVQIDSELCWKVKKFVKFLAVAHPD